MKVDLWTKIVFTVIAISLATLAVRSLQVIPAQATRGEIIRVNLIEIGGRNVFLYDLVKKPY